MTEIETTKNGLDRRAVIKGAAWSVPVIAAAVATPLAAASTDGQLAGRITTSGGCIPVLGALAGGHTITNTNNVPVTVTITQRIVVHSLTGIGTEAALDGWALAWTATSAPNFPSGGTCTNSGPLGSCYRREKSRTWTYTIPANSSYYVWKILPLTILNSPESNLTVTVGAIPVSGSPSHYEPKLLGTVCTD